MAAKIVWTPQMSVGVEEIDMQHKQFINILSDFFVAFDENRANAELSGILQRLIEYAEFHFKTEEDYFDKFNYELKEDHKQKHEEIKAKLVDFQKKFEQKNKDIVLGFMDFLTDWLVDHLETEDQKYVECFHSHGLY